MNLLSLKEPRSRWLKKARCRLIGIAENTKAVMKKEPEVIKPTSVLKIMCDVDSNEFVDGEYKADVQSGIAYKLQLEKAFTK